MHFCADEAMAGLTLISLVIAIKDLFRAKGNELLHRLFVLLADLPQFNPPRIPQLLVARQLQVDPPRQRLILNQRGVRHVKGRLARY